MLKGALRTRDPAPAEDRGVELSNALRVAIDPYVDRFSHYDRCCEDACDDCPRDMTLFEVMTEKQSRKNRFTSEMWTEMWSCGRKRRVY